MGELILVMLSNVKILRGEETRAPADRGGTFYRYLDVVQIACFRARCRRTAMNATHGMFAQRRACIAALMTLSGIAR